jgi:hypothetical protein
MLCLKSTGELGSSGCAGGNDVGCGWTKDDIGDEKIKLRLCCEFDCCIGVSTSLCEGGNESETIQYKININASIDEHQFP